MHNMFYSLKTFHRWDFVAHWRESVEAWHLWPDVTTVTFLQCATNIVSRRQTLQQRSSYLACCSLLLTLIVWSLACLLYNHKLSGVERLYTTCFPTILCTRHHHKGKLNTSFCQRLTTGLKNIDTRVWWPGQRLCQQKLSRCWMHWNEQHNSNSEETVHFLRQI